MTVEHPYAADEGRSFLSVSRLSTEQKKCLVKIAEQFAKTRPTTPPDDGPVRGDTASPALSPTPLVPFHYYIRGRKDLQLVHDAIAWYSGELTEQYEATTIKMIEGIMWEGITRLDEMKQQLAICIDILGESSDGE